MYRLLPEDYETMKTMTAIRFFAQAFSGSLSLADSCAPLCEEQKGVLSVMHLQVFSFTFKIIKIQQPWCTMQLKRWHGAMVFATTVSLHQLTTSQLCVDVLAGSALGFKGSLKHQLQICMNLLSVGMLTWLHYIWLLVTLVKPIKWMDLAIWKFATDTGRFLRLQSSPWINSSCSSLYLGR